jgi:hypothetical protein
MPTFRHGKNISVFIDEYDFSAYFSDITAADKVDTADITAFGAAGKAYVIGNQDGTVSLSGFFESTASTGTDQYFAGVKGSTTKQKVVVALEGATVGTRAVMLQADASSYQVSASVGDAIKASAEFQASESIDHGVILSSGAAISATGNGTGVDNAAATANGGVAFISVPANTRNGTIIVKVQSSADNSTFADLVTFTTVSSTTKTSERILVAAGTAVPRYLRVSYTVAGSTGSATPTVAFARR